MMVKDFQTCKNEVLKIYDNYVKFCEEYSVNLNDSIAKEAEKIKNDVFNLMILGEAKSGKSTLINAYLGKEVLPMDVLQCTSAIIKIRRGDEFKLIATKANNSKEEVKDEEKIKKFLEKHAAIEDNYRKIPVAAINFELLIYYKGEIKDEYIEKFLEKHKKDNIYNLDEEEYKKLIKDYINKNKDKWENIIKEIDIIYKLPEDMKGITIIDSPGVNAGGGVGEFSENYVEKANSIVFVKPLSGQAIESNSFKELLDSNMTDKQKETLFLVFTGKERESKANFEKLKKQAIEMFKKVIDKEKIIFVDSKIELFLNKCLKLKTVEKIGEFFDKLEKEGEDFPQASKTWLKARDNVEKFTKEMKELSNFDSVKNAINNFGRKAQYLQLEKFLKNIENEYIKYEGQYSSIYEDVKKNYKNPVELEKAINKNKAEIDNLSIKINKGVDAILKEYRGDLDGKGIILNEANEMIEKYKKELEQFINLNEYEITDNTFDKLKTMSVNAAESANDFRRKIADRVIEDFNKKLIEYENVESSISVKAYMPNFTEADFDKINKKAKEDTEGYEKVKEGKTFKKTTDKYFHHKKEHVKIVANSIKDRLNDNIIPDIRKNLIDYIDKCAEVYENKLKEDMENSKNKYDELIKDKDNNEKLEEQLKKYEDMFASIENNQKEIKSIKENLENHGEIQSKEEKETETKNGEQEPKEYENMSDSIENNDLENNIENNQKEIKSIKENSENHGEIQSKGEDASNHIDDKIREIEEQFEKKIKGLEKKNEGLEKIIELMAKEVDKAKPIKKNSKNNAVKQSKEKKKSNKTKNTKLEKTKKAVKPIKKSSKSNVVKQGKKNIKK